jgi:hypothetical protein
MQWDYKHRINLRYFRLRGVMIKLPRASWTAIKKTASTIAQKNALGVRTLAPLIIYSVNSIDKLRNDAIIATASTRADIFFATFYITTPVVRKATSTIGNSNFELIHIQ